MRPHFCKGHLETKRKVLGKLVLALFGLELISSQQFRIDPHTKASAQPGAMPATAALLTLSTISWSTKENLLYLEEEEEAQEAGFKEQHLLADGGSAPQCLGPLVDPSRKKHRAKITLTHRMKTPPPKETTN